MLRSLAIGRLARHMYCTNCKTELPEAANFCWHCGESQRRAATTPSYEYCRMHKTQAGKGLMNESHYQFSAVGTSGSGKEYFVVPPGDWIHCSKERRLLKAVKHIVEQLHSSGWENVDITHNEDDYLSYEYLRSVRVRR